MTYRIMKPCSMGLEGDFKQLSKNMMMQMLRFAIDLEHVEPRQVQHHRQRLRPTLFQEPLEFPLSKRLGFGRMDLEKTKL